MFLWNFVLMEPYPMLLFTIFDIQLGLAVVYGVVLACLGSIRYAKYRIDVIYLRTRALEMLAELAVTVAAAVSAIDICACIIRVDYPCDQKHCAYLTNTIWPGALPDLIDDPRVRVTIRGRYCRFPGLLKNGILCSCETTFCPKRPIFQSPPYSIKSVRSD